MRKIRGPVAVLLLVVLGFAANAARAHASKDPKPPALKAANRKAKHRSGFANLKKWIAQGAQQTEQLDLDGQSVSFASYPKVQLVITSKCQVPAKKKLKCQAFSALRKVANVKLKAATLNGGTFESQLELCKKLYGYERAARLVEPRRHFCWFDDDSGLELSSLHYFWTLQQAP